MPTRPLLAGRPPERSNQIVTDLRRQITSGRLAPGDQLPTRAEIETKFGASSVTVQRALHRLRRDGFITVNGRRGTYVAPRPPHLTRYALVFPNEPTEASSWVRFWTALENEADAMPRRAGVKISCYYSVNNHADSDDYWRLLDDVEAHRLAGIIFASAPFMLEGSPILEEPGIPRVGIMTEPWRDSVPAVANDGESFLERAVDYLAGKGRRRLAAIMPPGHTLARAKLEPLARRHGMTLHPYWVQLVTYHAPEAAGGVAHLLMHEGQHERPDGLIIGDDNLVEHATAGLIAAGVRVPEDIEVVAHCNFPWPTPSVVPVRRLGFDARAVLQSAMECLGRQRQGLPVNPLNMVPAVFEDEVRRPKKDK